MHNNRYFYLHQTYLLFFMIADLSTLRHTLYNLTFQKKKLILLSIIFLRKCGLLKKHVYIVFLKMKSKKQKKMDIIEYTRKKKSHVFQFKTVELFLK